jgi:hypothetical protein
LINNNPPGYPASTSHAQKKDRSAISNGVETMAQHDRLRALLFESIREYAGQTGLQIDVTEHTRLVGRDAPLDSLGLVMVLASFEAGINDAFGTQIVLADERAMSMERSPFRSVSSLVEYACILLDQTGKNGNGS